MIALTLGGVLLAVAVPGMRRAAHGQRMAAAAARFLHALHLARGEAVRRGVRVTLCTSADGTHCTQSQGWSQGWLVFRDPDADGRPGSGNQVLLVAATLVGARLTGNRPVASYVSYTPDGATRRLSGAFQAGTLSLCDHARLAPERRIVISRTGRPRLATLRAEPPPCP